ncbi:nucleoid occlusion protein [Clostridium thermosuccinogenes]|uniref:Nucleoid occlusion protein n=1 Tax=Clostridium thermosuccinogenes TaxID=84032 RepID=A0A2K2F7K9_9CLOT|nr:nucleoid occlusion protein [Pseudoclostridium thermosuccinogenes]AUS98506.1 nucleoid occlusion protein [Pseudoclostridium thermosuccinogenes]PNT90830.1 nucleoid occlusion protein [Pseudoclostridium thermosuccinogenes]PNT94758.1 nucleoid occlusion protein [Pseudoclostridium thermosuccinogenes]PNT95335.1 nucleoid occlusion protein [Pseudoclostridium thermosuccinogenes]
MLESKLHVSKNEKKEDLKNITYIKIENIRPNPYQPRKQFNKASLEELCESIKEYGVLQPINVRQISSSTYELVAGERRLRAATMAGLEEIPAIIVNVNDNNSAIMALIENLQRENLSYMEEAEGYSNLLNEHNLTQEELAQKIGKSQSTIANKVRLLKLPPLVKKILADNNLTERHARALLKLHDEQLQLKVLKHVCEKGLNVKKTEQLVERAIEKYTRSEKEKVEEKKRTKAIKDIRIFVNTVRQAIDLMKKSGVNAKAAQLDRGEYIEFIVRIPKKGVN